MPIQFRKKLLGASIAGLFLASLAPASQAEQDNLQMLGRSHPGAAQTSFTRMFPQLPPFAEQSDAMREQLRRLGEPGGLLDAQDNLSDPMLSITKPEVFSPHNPDNPNLTAGVTFFGQFLDHDITLDARSPLLANSNPRTTTNFRTPAFDLDSVYGGGPEDSPELYDASSGYFLFRVEAIPGAEAVSRKGATRYDLPRDASGQAIIAEGRNDENAIISQFHLAMLKFHNAVSMRLSSEHPHWSAERVFEEARRNVRWHYQWIIVHEFLPETIGQERVTALLQDRAHPEHPRIPIEFSVAAYRFGHSQVRPSYRLNFGPDGGPAFFAFIFDDSNDPNSNDPNDLRGGKRAARRFVDWQTFFKFDNTNFRPNKRIDTKLSSPLMFLPGSRGPAPGLPGDGVQSLASRNLIRHVNFGIPSGQAIAAQLKMPALTSQQLAELAPYGLDSSTPLWYYVLKEAEVMEQGLRLGPVGGYIVGKVFTDLLKADKSSYIAANPNWRPTLPAATPGDFHITDLLNFAGVVPPL